MRIVAYRKIQETLLVLVVDFKFFETPGGTELNPKPSQINKVLQPRDLDPLDVSESFEPSHRDSRAHNLTSHLIVRRLL
ncbi:hypothetical protein PHISCL_00945 [Aspergillus sclerotialis]|uniref:Uncharacterized protein n=1 Tax=Aspergillus sclerotialis TaxID=2070753 RepID=A0A3A3A4S0_9EURO|nr:hypothetical protein PHISCL_00945 [Aspergillus sclerotialis]